MMETNAEAPSTRCVTVRMRAMTSKEIGIQSPEKDAVTDSGRNGRILVVGQAVDLSTGNYNVLVARFLTNGTLDTSFGSGGMVRTPVSNAFIHGVAIQKNGQFVVGGHFALSGADYALTLLRYDSNGSLDTSFGVGGRAGLQSACTGIILIWCMSGARRTVGL